MRIGTRLTALLSTYMLGAMLVIGVSACVVLPQKDYSEKLTCGLSSDKKVLRVVNLTDGDTSFYRWNDEMMAFVTIPASAIISGTYVLVNNIYHTLEKTIKCNNAVSLMQPEVAAIQQPVTEDNIESNQPQKIVEQQMDSSKTGQ